MKTVQRHDRLTRREVVALRGLRLPSLALRKLSKSGIYCQPAVSIEYQQLYDRYVLLGKDSGGAVHSIGAYCGFVAPTGAPLAWVNRCQGVAPNGVHATVLAPQFVRIHVFRDGGTFDLLITRHELVARPEGKRPALHNHILFHGARGTAPLSVSGADAVLPARTLPEFRSRAGQAMPIPDLFHEAVRAALAGASCAGCRAPHLLLSPGINAV